MGWLDHKQLMIVKGIGKTPTDNNSNEISPVVINLMSGEGFSLTQDGWTPNIAAVKSGGVWSDSPISNGRQLLAAPVANVIEKMVILIKDNSYLGAMKLLDSLNRMAQDCRDYWQTDSQYNPVYISWWAGCGVGSQFAQLFNIEIAPDFLDSPTPTIRVSLTLEREPFWRGIPPGANPRLWTLYKNGTPPNTTNVSLITQTDDLIYETNLKNRFEWDTAMSNPVSRNYIDIPPSLLNGDAPALVEMMVQATTDAVNTTSSIFVGRSTIPTSIKDRNGNVTPQSLVFNAADAVVSVNWAKTADATCGCLGTASAVTKQIGRNAGLATGTYNTFAQWRFFNSLNYVSFNLMSGTYAVFWRCKQLNGALGDIQARIRIFDNFTTFLGGYNNLPLVAAAGATCENRFDLMYMGTVSLPLAGGVTDSSDGRGINTPQKNVAVPTASIAVDVIQNNVASRSVDFLDLIFLPINEGLINMLPVANGGGNFTWYAFDNTGYLSHGNPTSQGKTINWDGSITTTEAVMEIRGKDLTLIPNVNNRLYFIYQRAPAAGGTNFSAPDSSNDFANVRINIVPRWSSIRDA